MQYEEFIRERITALRIKKNVSEYRMSLDLGHSISYIRGINSGKALPSMREFLYICEYLGVTPTEFFDTGMEDPKKVRQLREISRDMSGDDLSALIDMANRIKK